MDRPRRRRSLLVHPVQFRLLGSHLIHGVILVVALGMVVFGPSVAAYLTTGSSDVRRAAAEELSLLSRRTWPGAIVVVALLVLHSVVISHRLAGPLLRFRDVHRQIGAGDFTARAALRSGDYLRDDAAALNRMAAALEDRAAAIRRLAGAVESAVGAEAAPDGELTQAWTKMARAVSAMAAADDHPTP